MATARNRNGKRMARIPICASGSCRGFFPSRSLWLDQYLRRRKHEKMGVYFASHRPATVAGVARLALPCPSRHRHSRPPPLTLRAHPRAAACRATSCLCCLRRANGAGAWGGRRAAACLRGRSSPPSAWTATSCPRRCVTGLISVRDRVLGVWLAPAPVQSPPPAERHMEGVIVSARVGDGPRKGWGVGTTASSVVRRPNNRGATWLALSWRPGHCRQRPIAAISTLRQGRRARRLASGRRGKSQWCASDVGGLDPPACPSAQQRRALAPRPPPAPPPLAPPRWLTAAASGTAAEPGGHDRECGDEDAVQRRTAGAVRTPRRPQTRRSSPWQQAEHVTTPLFTPSMRALPRPLQSAASPRLSWRRLCTPCSSP